ncbi:DMT family transporter [Altererythrobacter sp. H2]|uniref:DMT family transporter n=1 Tax=Altererythrobacter sp. H2 TaxID=3108391 RepID=UPI002B4C2043|nr:DMT family transporter [Altererythrobacter sp. H2]WRK94954.1 DMT family transporter [Altererythrobacter sp. H2]
MNTPQSSAFLPIAAMMFAAGIGIPVFAAFNSGLSKQLGGPIAATAAAFAVGLAIALALLALTGLPQRSTLHFEVPYIWFGAVFILFYGVSVTFAAPRIGLGNAIFFVLLGQIVAAAAIDHFGWLGAIQSSLTPRRMLGIAIMAIGLYLARKPL